MAFATSTFGHWSSSLDHSSFPRVPLGVMQDVSAPGVLPALIYPITLRFAVLEPAAALCAYLRE